jgi:exodeoxyribonuclease V alpha subunit
MEQITGIVKTIIYTNESNGYTICQIKEGRKAHTLVGTMPLLMPGESITAMGEWTTHPDYGPQFSVSECKRQIPTELEEMERYLGSGFIKGLGSATAKKIVSRFKEETFAVLQSDPLRLAEIKGIRPEKALAFGQAFSEHESMRGVVMLVQKFGISSLYATKIWKKFGTSAEGEIQKNPYRLMDPDVGLGFKTCDSIALRLGIDPCSEFRLKSAIWHRLSHSILNGHTYYLKDDLISETHKLTNVPEQLIHNAFDGLLLESEIHIERQHADRVYAHYLFEAERYCARRLTALNQFIENGLMDDVHQWLSHYEKQNRISLDENQKTAIKTAIENGVTVITGGPGTGKTTIIKALIEIFQEHGVGVLLCAPTGRAAKRISETSGYEAKTVHRLLEVGYEIGQEDRAYFSRNEENPLDADVIIMDEASMIDIVILSSLLKAMKPGTRLILVGDADQLPSVGPGNVLSDIIESGEVPVVKLDKIFRQSEESMIIVNAHRINQGMEPILNTEEGDFYFIPRLDPGETVEAVIELCASHIPDRFGYDFMRDIQVLTPMRKGDTGVYNLNARLQQRINPPHERKPQKLAGGIAYRVGDRVMQIKNDYNKVWTQMDMQGKLSEGLGVYNGDTGVITDVDLKNQIITVRYEDQRICEYTFDTLDNLEHAYAVTVHKSQGSEFPAVVIPLLKVPPMLVYRNLLYTAITRAKRLVVIIGNPDILRRMIEDSNERERYSGLKERLCAQNRLS